MLKFFPALKTVSDDVGFLPKSFHIPELKIKQ